MIETIGSDVFVRIRTDLLVVGDSIMTDRHHASNGNYEDNDPQNQIGGIIPAFSLAGWRRHGMEKAIQERGGTACHPGEANANFRKDGVYNRDLDSGYHEKGSCVDTDPHGEHGCLVYELFGGFGDRAGRIIRRPIGFSPIRRQVDVTKGEAEAHFRQLHTQVRSRNDDDEGQPLRHATRDVVGNLEGTWRLTLRELRPEYVGLLVEAIDYLNEHSDAFEMQLGGARNFGAGIVDAKILNPLYTTQEVRRVYNRAQKPTATMQSKDDVWNEACRQQFLNALQARISVPEEGRPSAVDGEVSYES
jgi:hypothetical protein